MLTTLVSYLIKCSILGTLYGSLLYLGYYLAKIEIEDRPFRKAIERFTMGKNL